MGIRKSTVYNCSSNKNRKVRDIHVQEKEASQRGINHHRQDLSRDVEYDKVVEDSTFSLSSSSTSSTHSSRQGITMVEDDDDGVIEVPNNETSTSSISAVEIESSSVGSNQSPSNPVNGTKKRSIDELYEGEKSLADKLDILFDVFVSTGVLEDVDKLFASERCSDEHFEVGARVLKFNTYFQTSIEGLVAASAFTPNTKRVKGKCPAEDDSKGKGKSEKSAREKFYTALNHCTTFQIEKEMPVIKSRSKKPKNDKGRKTMSFLTKHSHEYNKKEVTPSYRVARTQVS